jgi:hypothetical protein
MKTISAFCAIARAGDVQHRNGNVDARGPTVRFRFEGQQKSRRAAAAAHIENALAAAGRRKTD